MRTAARALVFDDADQLSLNRYRPIRLRPRSGESLTFRHGVLQLLDELAQACVEFDLVSRLREDLFTYVVDERLPGFASAPRALGGYLLQLLDRRLFLVRTRPARSRSSATFAR
ncbi:hypothetical protein [Actinoplanes sp. NPDC049802]|uniref:hypothetical protein n=1 Tax=Actinoplanes sp. NPDC049802 TaxID=3154742 RepID=UPI0033F7930D